MGKLHTLRRAVERNPDRWLTSYGLVYGAEYRTKPPWTTYEKWNGPGWYPKNGFFCGNPKSYRDYITKVLIDLGYTKKLKRNSWRGYYTVLEKYYTAPHLSKHGGIESE